MKQSLFMLMLMAVSLPWTVFNPFAGLVVYYGLALLRPQFLWRQTLEIDWRYSFILGLVILASYVLHAISRKARPHKWVAEKWMLAALTVLTVLSYLNAFNRAASYQNFTDLMKIFIMFFVAVGLVDTRWRLRVLAITIVIALGWVAIDLNQRYVLMGQRHIAIYGHGGLDNNGLAALMVMAIPFCLFLFETEKKWYLKWPPLLLLPAMIHVVLFSMSRGGMLGLIVIAPFLLLRTRHRWKGALLGLVLVGLAFRLAGPEVRSRFLSIERHETDASAQGRLISWGLALDVMRDYPLLGAGPRGFNQVAERYNPEFAKRSVHNQILQTGADLGAPAAAALVVALGAALWRMRNVRRRCREDDFAYNLAGCLQTSLIGYLTVGVFLTLGTVEFSYIVLAMVVGLWEVTAGQEALAKAPAEANPAPALGGIAAAGA